MAQLASGSQDLTMPAAHSNFSSSEAIMLLALAAIWGFTFFFIEIAIAGLTPLWLVAVRTLTGFLVLLIAMWVRRVGMPHGGVIWLHIAVLAVVGNVVPWSLVAWAQESITSSLTAVLYTLIPVFTLLISVVWSMERLTAHRVAGLAIALLGSVLVIGVDPGARVAGGPVLAVLGACVLLATGGVYAKRFVTPYISSLPMVTTQLGLAFGASAVVALLANGSPEWAAITPSVAGAALALGAAGTGLAFILYYELIERVGATNASLVSYLIPLVALVAGWMVLDERISGPLILGAASIIAGVWLAQRSSRAVHIAPVRP